MVLPLKHDDEIYILSKSVTILEILGMPATVYILAFTVPQTKLILRVYLFLHISGFPYCDH